MSYYKEIELTTDKKIKIETGKLAKLTNGSAMVTMGETMVLATVAAKNDAIFQGFLPLQVEYREKFSAGGKFPGGFLKREGRPSEKEILSSRLIDRALRPLFPAGYVSDTQIIITVFSSDTQNDSDVLGGIAASAALIVSDLPFTTPMAEVRVGRVGKVFIINPTVDELKHTDLEICIGGTKDTICMLEGEMHEISEIDMLEALKFGHTYIKKICEAIDALQKECGKIKKEFVPFLPVKEDADYLKSLCYDKFEALNKQTLPKEERLKIKKEIYSSSLKTALAKYTLEITPEIIEKTPAKELLLNKSFLDSIIHNFERTSMRESVLNTKKRLDGRDLNQIRPISIEAGLLPRNHGSALFTRGETQALVSLTLGTKKDEQMIDTLFSDTGKRFMLHYNFPPFSVGEVGRIGSTGRREIGHGNLAERAIKMVLPNETDFPYSIRVVSDILESNGSSSMATVCGATLAALDGGVPLKKSVAGIAMGLIKEQERFVILSDILGDEDHLGDMDFKVAGTSEGITACQMDIKIDGLDYAIVEKALAQALEGRLHILGKMNQVLSTPRTDLSKYAPRLTSIQIPNDTIGALIGKGGETIRFISNLTNSQIDIGDNAMVTIASTSGSDTEMAIAYIKAITSGEPQPNTWYRSKVKEVRDDLGVIIDFCSGFPNQSGLVHFSEIDLKEGQKPSDVVKSGDVVDVRMVRVSRDKKTGRPKYGYSLKAKLTVPVQIEHP